jgi:hypothetical protein
MIRAHTAYGDAQGFHRGNFNTVDDLDYTENETKPYANVDAKGNGQYEHDDTKDSANHFENLLFLILYITAF